MSENYASLQNITKFYGTRLIFKNICLELKNNSLTILTGANGSGKSTLLNIMAGLIAPDSGTIKINPAIKTGYLGHSPFLYPGLTAYENLAFWLKSSGLAFSKKIVTEVLEKTGLFARANDLVRYFSKGMLQKLNFARLLLNKPKLILLDEPYSGLDQNAKTWLGNEIANLKNEGCAILLISHDIKQESQHADRICTIQDYSLNTV